MALFVNLDAKADVEKANHCRLMRKFAESGDGTFGEDKAHTNLLRSASSAFSQISNTPGDWAEIIAFNSRQAFLDFRDFLYVGFIGVESSHNPPSLAQGHLELLYFTDKYGSIDGGRRPVDLLFERLVAWIAQQVFYLPTKDKWALVLFVSTNCPTSSLVAQRWAPLRDTRTRASAENLVERLTRGLTAHEWLAADLIMASYTHHKDEGHLRKHLECISTLKLTEDEFGELTKKIEATSGDLAIWWLKRHIGEMGRSAGKTLHVDPRIRPMDHNKPGFRLQHQLYQ